MDHVEHDLPGDVSAQSKSPKSADASQEGCSLKRQLWSSHLLHMNTLLDTISTFHHLAYGTTAILP